MTIDFTTLQAEALKDVATAEDADTLEQVRVKWLGRKGQLTAVLRSVSEAPADERPALGKAANQLKAAVNEALVARTADLAPVDKMGDTFDFTLPGRTPALGHKHLITQTMEEIVGIFAELGYQVAEGPDIESEYYNFDALNTPADHPARDSHDTFYVEPGTVLRTHTSPVQIRTMERFQPPVAVVVPGRVYRVDFDASHSPMFFQLEGLLVDTDVTFADLKGTLIHFIHRLFGKDKPIRFRPHFFPFTEPSAEVDLLWTSRDPETGAERKRWLEILGCGMVHPEVFRHVGYEYPKYKGFAFGMGIDRIAMIRHNIPTIHHLYENDMRFLEQF
jgi:phenylalanyl-tRNA synthetase alpha chain